MINENISFEVIKLNRRDSIHGCLTRDGMVHIKLGEHREHGKGIKILHKSHFCERILNYKKEKEYLFHDVLQELKNSV